MSWLETLRTGVNGVRSHRLRSSLTVLGILIGIAGVIVAVGLGEGASSQVTSEINSLGSNVLTITPGSTTSSIGDPRGTGLGIDAHDAGRLRALLPRRRARHQGGRRHHLGVRGPHGGERDGHDDGAGHDAVVADRPGPHGRPRVVSSTTKT